MKKLVIGVFALCAAVVYGEDPINLVKAIRDAGLEPTITASAASSSAAKIYDGNGGSQWTPNENNWNCLAVPAEFRPGEKIILKGYTVKNAVGQGNFTLYCSRVAHTWDIEGSNDGVTWTKLDSKANVAWYGSASYVYGERSYTYGLENTEPYRYYRINVIKSNADGYCSFTWLDYLVDIVPGGGDFRYTVNSVTCDWDGESHSASVTTYEDKPADLVITYATEPDGEYGPNPTAFSEVGVHTNWIHLTSGGKTITDFAIVAISGRPLAEDWISVPDVEYTGEACEPKVTVVDPERDELEEDADFAVVYSDNTACGTATATVTGIGNYRGEIAKTFSISPRRSAGSIYVSPTGSDSGTGEADKPWPLDTALLAALPGATIHFAEGTYERTATLNLSSRSNLTFAAADGAAVEICPAADARIRLVAIGTSSNLVFRGITFARGYVSGGNGGAVDVTESKDVLFDGCQFKTNFVSEGCGGALAVAGSSSVTVSNSLFEANTTSSSAAGRVGGAVYAKESTFTAANSVFRRNKATSTSYLSSYGAAAYFDISTTVSFSNCLVVQNGGLSASSVNPCFSAIELSTDASHPGTLTISKCTIAENLALLGVHTARTTVRVSDSIIWGHLCDESHMHAATRSNTFDGFIHYWDGSTARCNYNGFKSAGPILYEGRPDFDVDYRLTAASAVTGKGYVHPTDAATEVRTWFVAPSGDDEADGSAATPFKTIARALESATDGDTIRLAEGTYSAATTGEAFPVDLTGRFFLTFEGTGRGKTVLDGENVAAAFWTIDQSDHIVLKGMTMRRSRQTAAASGCGVSAKRNGTLYLRELAFEDCALAPADTALAASTWRGPISIANSTYAEVEDCSVKGTTADFTDCTNAQTLQGAGLYAYYAQVRAERCSFTDASVTGNGTLASGVYGGRADKCMATLLLRNALVAQSGGVYANYAYAYLYNNTMTGNACGLSCNNGTSKTFLNAANNLIYGNDDDCLGCSNDDDNVIIHVFANNLFTSTTTDYLTQSKIEANYEIHKAPSGTQLADRSPFAAEGKYPFALRRSAADSVNPAVDNAKEYDWMTGATDLAGNPRISKSTRKGEELPDIGCYELGCYTPGLMLMVK